MRAKLRNLIYDIGRDYDDYVDSQHEIGMPVYEDFDEWLTDALIANGAILPPCRVGQTVYIIENGDMLDIEPSVCSIVEDETYEMSYGTTQSGELKWLYLVLNSGEDFYDTDIGKTVFLTKEDAEKALKEKENGTVNSK